MDIIGIEAMGLYVPQYYVDMRDLAAARGVDSEKYVHGIGQERMGVPPPDEDVVTMAASAAKEALRGVDRNEIDTLIFATETGVDQSKAAAIYVHRLLDLPRRCTCFEVKQACCSSTAAVQMALALVAQRPEKKVLVVASDIARYGLESAGEPTQGAGAVAMVLSATPCLVAFDFGWGVYTEEVMDFWRPNYREEALVDGKYSVKVYLKALAETWMHYREETGRAFEDHDRFCYHLPFTRMAEKAHHHLAKLETVDAYGAQIEDSLHYNRIIGNSYTASLYVGLLSLLETSTIDLSGKRIGFFSYGSGCMACFFSGTVCPEYRTRLSLDRVEKQLDTRTRLSVEMYEAYYRHELPTDGSRYATPVNRTGAFRLAGIDSHKRLYAQVPPQAAMEPDCDERLAASVG